MSGIEHLPIEMLPHKYPFLLIDKVVEVETGKRLVALKNITRNEPQFSGHFPDRPIMPGVLLCEAMAQAGGLLVHGTLNDGFDIDRAVQELFLVLTTLEHVRFRRQVVPGDQVLIEVEMVRKHRPLWKLKGRATVDGNVCAQAEFSAVEVDPDRADGGRSVEVHETAVVAREAELEAGVVVGPYSIVGANVHLGPGVRVESHVTIDGHTTIGRDCVISPYASVGSVPQDLKFHGEAGRLVIGERNRIRESATLSIGTEAGGMQTTVGDDNLFMNFSHVAHDCKVGSHCVLANGAQIAGHVSLEDRVIVSGLAAIAQFVRVGESAFLGGGSMVNQDIPPFCLASGDRARLVGLNVVGLERRGFSSEEVSYRILFRSKRVLKEALAEVRQEMAQWPHVLQFIEFVEACERGVTRP